MSQTAPDIAAQLREALRLVPLPTTVALVRSGSEIRGATVTSFMPVALDPPTVALSIQRGRFMHEPLLEAATFSINVLAAGQEHLADHFSSSTNRSLGVQPVRYASTPGGAPSMPNSLAVFECRPTTTTTAHIAIGTHTLYLADVTGIETDADADPLLWAAGAHAYIEHR